jgi:magnesium transporter
MSIIDLLESYRDAIRNVMDLYISSLSMRTNEVMRVLTIISTIFIPLTFLVGVYGMNFEHMPELHSEYGYVGIWTVMLAVALGMIAFFKHRKWF